MKLRSEKFLNLSVETEQEEVNKKRKLEVRLFTFGV